MKTISHDLAKASQTSKVKKITKNVANKKRTEVAYTPYNFGFSKGFPQSKTSSSKILFPASIKPTCFTSQVSPLHKNLYFDERRTRRLRPSINTGLFMTQSVYTENPSSELQPTPVNVNLDKVSENQNSKELREMQSMSNRYSKYSKESFVPCLYLKAKTQKVLLYFHANGEDLDQVLPIIKQLNTIFNINVIAVEYPGYGIYTNPANIEGKKAKVVIDDAVAVYRFIVDILKIKQDDIIIAGRSIGSGPACHLASIYKPQALFLISPIKSVNDTARKICGPIAKMLIEERFNNFEKVVKVTCPTIIVHGLQDSMVDFHDSIQLLMQGFTNSKCHLFLRDQMGHNKFNYEFDIIKPLEYFFSYEDLKIGFCKKTALKSSSYIDLKTQKYRHLPLFKNDSKYYNNFKKINMPAQELIVNEEQAQAQD